MRRLLAAIACTLGLLAASAQEVMPARANVAAYYNEADIARNNYREQPYYMELSGGWQQRQTDSSLQYIRHLEPEKAWRDYLVSLNVRCGRAARISLNGKPVGYAGDSRHWNEFLLSPFLKYDRDNTLVVEAMKQSPEALLENSTTDIGLNGLPYLLFKNDPQVADYTIETHYDASQHSGTLGIAANIFCSRKKGKYYLEAEVLEPNGHSLGRTGRWIVFRGDSEQAVSITQQWNGISPWNAEQPTLYTLILRLRDEKMQEEETIGTRFGFRKIEIKEGQLLLNGQAITIKGVTYGLPHTEGEAAREQMKRDVSLMKSNNINAVRTAQYSPLDPYFYELCDEMGLYVVADANLLPLSDQTHAVATDASYTTLFERRVENLYGSYKNHTSIIAWSLGETEDNGTCMNAAYRRLKLLDATRPVLFSAAGYGKTTDIIAPLLPKASDLSKKADRPTILLMAVDNEHFTSLGALWATVEQQRNLQGGFACPWPLQETKLAELKQLYSPFSVKLIELKNDEAEFVINNLTDFSSLGNYTIEYDIFTNFHSHITGGDLTSVARGGESEKTTIRIPHLNLQAGEEAFIHFTLKGRTASQKTQIVGYQELPLPLMKAQRTLVSNIGNADSGRMASFPTLSFAGHDDWRCQLVDQTTQWHDSTKYSVSQLIQAVDPNGNTMCDVRCTQTVFGPNDIVTEYSISPSDRIQQEKIRPVVSIACNADTIEWYGPDREQLFTGLHTTHTATFRQACSPMRRQQVRWCAAQSSRESIFVQFLDCRHQMEIAENTLKLTPESPLKFRLHRHYGDTHDIAGLLSADYPPMATNQLSLPIIKASSSRFSQPMEVTITSPDKATIYYTVDGSEPSDNSLLYTSPIIIQSTTTVKARAYDPSATPSFVSTRHFNYDHIRSIRFSRRPNTPYNIGADSILSDGVVGDVTDLSFGWLGFAGGDVATDIELAQSITVSEVTLRYAHAPDTWAFAPRSVAILLSADGERWGDTLVAEIPFDPADSAQATARIVEVDVAVDSREAKYLKIIPTPLSTIPLWHRGKGLKPWLLMDEITVTEKPTE